MQHHGWLETMIHAKHPAHQIVVRNLSVAGDEVVSRARSKDFGTPDEWLTKVQAGVVFAFFGYNESFAGPEGLPKFKEDLATVLRETRAKNYNSLGSPRIVLFSPIATEKHPDSNFEYKPEVNANLALYTGAMADVARDLAGVTFVNLFQPSQELFAEAARNKQPPLTINGVHLNEAGEGRLTEKIYPALFGDAAPAMHTGAYEYVCTFPGHWTVMYGQLIVTKDVEVHQNANPIAQLATPAASAHNHQPGSSVRAAA